jgi:hypothetical protein
MKRLTNILLFIVIALFTTCGNPMKLQVPTQFAEQSTLMPVKKQKHRQYVFGNYSTTTVRRGWKSTGERYNRPYNSMEQILLRLLFDIDKNSVRTTEKDKFHYTVGNDTLSFYVFCKQRTVTTQTRIQTPVRVFEKMENEQYDFMGAIIPYDPNEKPWKLVMNYYMEKKQGLAGLFDFRFPGTSGFMTDEIDTILIKPVFVNKTDNKENANLPFRLPSGYEFSTADGVIAIVDTLGKNIWVYNGLGAMEKMIMSAAASAILFRDKI